MTKNTKTLLTIAVLGGVGYLIYKQMNKPKSFSNAVGSEPRPPKGFTCAKGFRPELMRTPNGGTTWVCGRIPNRPTQGGGTPYLPPQVPTGTGSVDPSQYTPSTNTNTNPSIPRLG